LVCSLIASTRGFKLFLCTCRTRRWLTTIT
jgi:hypothetical protein